MFDIKNYVEASASNDESVYRMGKFKYTGRDKPKGLEDLSSKSISKGTDTDNYFFEENKMVCRFSSSHHLHIYEESDLQMQDIQAMVKCGNSSDGVKYEIQEKLSESGKKVYKADRSDYAQRKQKNTNVVTTDGGESNFKYTLNVVTPKDGREQHLVYIQVFDEVVRKGISRVAMPLLEIGTFSFYIYNFKKFRNSLW